MALISCSRWSMFFSLLLLWVIAVVFITMASMRLWEDNTYVVSESNSEIKMIHSETPRTNNLAETEADLVDTAPMLSQDPVQNRAEYKSTVIDRPILTRGKALDRDINTQESSEVQISSTPLTTTHPTSNQNCSNISVYPPPISKPSGCRENHCAEFLTLADKNYQKSCVRETQMKVSLLKENNCSFMDGRNRLPVALISPEGSGNTWVRGLLEKATGICTGFIYCDYVMRKQGFIGENVRSGSVLVAKTHSYGSRWSGVKYKTSKSADPYYGSAIFLLRNPYHTAIAEWNRRVTNNFIIPKHLPHNESHTNTVPREYWDIDAWNRFLTGDFAKGWQTRINNWVLDGDVRPVLVVRYEDLKKDTATEVAKMLDFLNIEYTSRQDIHQRICQGYTEFKRLHTAKDDFEHFTQKQRDFIGSLINDVLISAKAVNKSHILKLEEYIM